MPANAAAFAKRSDKRAQQRAHSRGRLLGTEAAAGAVGRSIGRSNSCSSFMTAADNARRKLSSKDQILAVDATGKPYPKSSLFCLSVNNPLRQATIRTIRWPGSSMIDATPASSPRSCGTSAVTWLGQLVSALHAAVGWPARHAGAARLPSPHSPSAGPDSPACRHHWQCLTT